MVCYRPLKAIRYPHISWSDDGVDILNSFKVYIYRKYDTDVAVQNKLGVPLLFDQNANRIVTRKEREWEYLSLPCGKCVGCLLARGKHWAIRCLHEASFHEKNCMITLTFDDENLDKKRSLNKRDFQLFMKRLRKHFEPQRIRYFHCGEYGGKLGRPHHHALLFGLDFDDKWFWKYSGSGKPLYCSDTLTRIWGNGIAAINCVTFDSAAYVARYVLKKHYGQDSSDYYGDLLPEYTTMSRRPGIGADWIQKFMGDVYPKDFIIYENGLKMKPPRYYDDKYCLQDPDDYARIKMERKLGASASEYTFERLRDLEEIQLLNLRKLPRSLDYAL